MRPKDALYGTGIAVVFAPWRKIWGGSFTPAVMDECWYALRFISLRKFSKELLCERFRMRRADLLTLAAQAGSYGEYLPSHPIGSLVRLAVNLAGNGMAGMVRVHGA